MIKVLLLSLLLVGIAFLGIGFNIVFRRKKFPDTHIGGNKEMQKRGIYCAKTTDGIERKGLSKNNKYKKVVYNKPCYPN